MMIAILFSIALVGQADAVQKFSDLHSKSEFDLTQDDANEIGRIANDPISNEEAKAIVASPLYPKILRLALDNPNTFSTVPGSSDAVTRGLQILTQALSKLPDPRTREALRIHNSHLGQELQANGDTIIFITDTTLSDDIRFIAAYRIQSGDIFSDLKIFQDLQNNTFANAKLRNFAARIFLRAQNLKKINDPQYQVSLSSRFKILLKDVDGDDWKLRNKAEKQMTELLIENGDRAIDILRSANAEMQKEKYRPEMHAGVDRAIGDFRTDTKKNPLTLKTLVVLSPFDPTAFPKMGADLKAHRLLDDLQKKRGQ